MATLQSFVDSPQRFLFFTGKGGVGKTSLACAVGVALADRGKRVLLISTDPASNLDEVLETRIGVNPTPIAEVPNLWALNIDPQEAAHAYRERIVGPIRGVLPEEAVANIEEQLSGACTTEIASFNEFSRLIGDASAVANFDHVVMDTAPTGHTLRLLNLPAAWSEFIVTNTTGSSCLGPMSGLKDQKEIYQQAVETLQDASQTTLALVARADQASLKEAARASEELRSQGILNQQLIVNAIFQAMDPNDPIASTLQKEGEKALQALSPQLADLPRIDVPFRPVGTVGVEGLRALFAPQSVEAFTAIKETLPQDQRELPSLAGLVEDLRTSRKGVIMTMGKGGVGKTSVAIHIAQRLAADGTSVLLATTDPADHITGAIKDAPGNLTIEAIDPKSVTERHVARTLAQAEAEGTLDEDARALLEEELRSPCIEEIAVFTAFAEIVARGQEQFVVLDTAPTGHTLLLLDTTEAYHRQVAKSSNHLSEEVRKLLPRLRDPEFSKLLIVTLAEATPVHEASFLQEDLRRAGIEPYAWVVNRSFHGITSSDPLLQAKRVNEGPYLSEVEERLAQRVAIVPFQLSGAPQLTLS